MSDEKVDELEKRIQRLEARIAGLERAMIFLRPLGPLKNEFLPVDAIDRLKLEAEKLDLHKKYFGTQP